MRFCGGVLVLVIVLHSDPAMGKVPSSRFLLEELLTSVERLLFFLHSRVDQMSLESSLGVAVASGQLSSAIRYISRNSSISSKHLIRKLCYVKDHCSTLLSVSREILRKNNQVDFNALGKLLDPWYWETDSPKLACNESPLGETHGAVDEQRPDGQASDACIARLLSRPCDGSEPLCWRGVEFAPEASAATGYALSHRLIYARVARKASHCVGKRKSDLDVIISSICCKMLREAKEIAGKGYPSVYRDLFMEQVALCGVENFMEYANPIWLRNIMSWQRSSGCYGSKREQRIGTQVFRSVFKRSESVMDYGCLSHASGVALASLAASIRLMIE